MPLDVVRDPHSDLSRPLPVGAQLRRIKNITRDRLAPAIHAALQIGAATLRNRRTTDFGGTLPGQEPIDWRASLGAQGPVALSTLVTFLWNRGVPVIPLQRSPSPTFQALAAVIGSDPIIVLGHRLDEPGRAAFSISHEIAHIVRGDCLPDFPVVEADDETSDEEDIEAAADAFAHALLIGDRAVPDVKPKDFRSLASAAHEIELAEGVDAGAIIWAWARKTGEYAVAQRALHALFRTTGAQRELIRHFEAFVNVERASDSDQDLFRCVVGGSDDDPASH